MNEFSSISEGLAALRRREMLIVVDNPKRENEGDFFMPAEVITSSAITTMLKQGSGVLCVAMTPAQQKRLKLPLMVTSARNKEKTGVRFTIGVSARTGITTGVSAFDRARTIRRIADPASTPRDLSRPGHVLGLVAAKGGLEERQGHTEAAVTLAKLAGFEPAGVLCEILREDGRMARIRDLTTLAKKLKIRMIALDDLINYVKKN